MSLGHGPKIATDGLVFAYDMSNVEKSWKGAPYKNELRSSVGWWGDGGHQSNFLKNLTLVVDAKLKYRGLPTVLWSPGTNRNSYLHSSDLDFSSESTQWTFSCFVKREDGLPITAMSVYMYYPNGDGASSGTIQNMGNGWYKIYRTRTGSLNYISLVGFTGMASNVKYYLSGPMLTKTTFPVYPTNAQSTRSNTESLLDLTKNNTITTNSLTYNTEGIFDFNGSSNYISTGLFSGRDPSSEPFTIEAWVKSDTTSGGRMWIDASGNGSNQRLYSSLINPLSGSATGIQGTAWTSSGSTPQDTNWHQQVIVMDGSTARMYADGVEVDTKSYTPYTLAGPIILGGRSGYYWNGKIDLAKIYDRALSPIEVKQNYEATKGRF